MAENILGTVFFQIVIFILTTYFYHLGVKIYCSHSVPVKIQSAMPDYMCISMRLEPCLQLTLV